MAYDLGTRVTSVDSGGAGATADLPLLVLAGLILLLPLLSLLVLSALALRRDRRATGAAPVPSDGRVVDDSTARPAVIDVQLVLVQTTASTFVIDGVVVRHGSPLAPIGWPVTYRVRRPQSQDLDLAIRAMLDRWVAQDEVVGFATTGTEPRRRVSITSGPSVLRLEADPADSRHLRP